MTDDVSAIPTSGCNILSNATTVNNYSNGVRRTYYQLGGKWVFASQQEYYNLPNNYVCVDVSVFNSNAAFEPIFVGIAFCLVVFVYLLWFNIFKRITRWKL